jgi:hypothetical protein
VRAVAATRCIRALRIHRALLVEHRFDLEVEIHLITDDAAGFEDRVEADPKVAPVEPADGSRPHAVGASETAAFWLEFCRGP